MLKSGNQGDTQGVSVSEWWIRRVLSKNDKARFLSNVKF
jgi:hypothetical protein